MVALSSRNGHPLLAQDIAHSALRNGHLELRFVQLDQFLLDESGVRYFLLS